MVFDPFQPNRVLMGSRGSGLFGRRLLAPGPDVTPPAPILDLR